MFLKFLRGIFPFRSKCHPTGYHFTGSLLFLSLSCVWRFHQISVLSLDFVGVSCPVFVASLTTDQMLLPCLCPIFVASLTTDRPSLSWLLAFHSRFVVLLMSQGSVADPDELFVPSGSACGTDQSPRFPRFIYFLI